MQRCKFHTALVEDPDSHHAEEEAKQNTSIGMDTPMRIISIGNCTDEPNRIRR